MGILNDFLYGFIQFRKAFSVWHLLVNNKYFYPDDMTWIFWDLYLGKPYK
jgi:hypothetical protein